MGESALKHHKDLTAARWAKKPLVEQLAHVGGEIERAFRARGRGEEEGTRLALERALELLDLTIEGRPKGLKEITRLREFLLGFFTGENPYGFSETFWKNYFLLFSSAAALHREKTSRR